MRGYPKHIATKQDFENLLSIKEFKAQALKDLERLSGIKDDRVKRVISGSEETKDLVTEEIDNPMPLWKSKGFKNRNEIAALIAKHRKVVKQNG